MALCLGLPGWAGTRKVKPIFFFTEARDSEWQWHQQVCTSLQTDNHASTPPLSFLQAGCPSWCLTNSVKALKTWRWVDSNIILNVSQTYRWGGHWAAETAGGGAPVPRPSPHQQWRHHQQLWGPQRLWRISRDCRTGLWSSRCWPYCKLL